MRVLILTLFIILLSCSAHSVTSKSQPSTFLPRPRRVHGKARPKEEGIMFCGAAVLSWTVMDWLHAQSSRGWEVTEGVSAGCAVRCVVCALTWMKSPVKKMEKRSKG
jgi:hypothetical protein